MHVSIGGCNPPLSRNNRTLVLICYQPKNVALSNSASAINFARLSRRQVTWCVSLPPPFPPFCALTLLFSPLVAKLRYNRVGKNCLDYVSSRVARLFFSIHFTY